jgi:hypothetical protein
MFVRNRIFRDETVGRKAGRQPCTRSGSRTDPRPDLDDKGKISKTFGGAPWQISCANVDSCTNSITVGVTIPGATDLIFDELATV